jgi:hypothetical protein
MGQPLSAVVTTVENTTEQGNNVVRATTFILVTAQATTVGVQAPVHTVVWKVTPVRLARMPIATSVRLIRTSVLEMIATDVPTIVLATIGRSI